VSDYGRFVLSLGYIFDDVIWCRPGNIHAADLWAPPATFIFPANFCCGEAHEILV